MCFKHLWEWPWVTGSPRGRVPNAVVAAGQRTKQLRLSLNGQDNIGETYRRGIHATGKMVRKNMAEGETATFFL